MNALPLLPVVAYLKFAMYMLLVWFVVVRLAPRLRSQVIFMSCWGGVGGVLAGAWHRQDFWNPLTVWGYPESHAFLTVEDFLFGLAFAGSASILFPLVTSWRLERGLPYGMHVSRQWKAMVLFGPFVMGLLCFLGGLNSLLACSVIFLVGAVAIVSVRTDLAWSALLGALLVTMFFAVVLGLFLREQPNSQELAQVLCQFYVRNGLTKTSLALLWWVVTFGAWITALYPFITNRRYVKPHP